MPGDVPNMHSFNYNVDMKWVFFVHGKVILADYRNIKKLFRAREMN